MPEKGKMIIEVEGDLSKIKKSIHGMAREPFALKLDDKNFSQPLGRITGKLGEFDKSLEASNARVIAFGASAGAIYAVQRALKETVSAAIQVEKSLSDINVILGANEKNLARFGDQLFRIAGQTGQSFQVVAEAATELARQGLSVEQTLKRTSDALILTRLSGLDAVSSVESLTAAINSFNRVALTSTEIVNKLANVDAAFAVSSGDLAEALRRVGSTASDAGVSFDQLIAAVTSAQQTTARGGSVIGNSFKTIFTRLQRPAVLKQLEQLGIKTKGVGDTARPVIGILTDLAKTYDKLSTSQRANISELVGGVFQINIVKAALADLGKEYSIYDRALATSVNSTDEAIKRNEQLNKTLSALINRTFANLQKVGAKVGEGAFGPAIKNVLGFVNDSLAGSDSEKGAESFGSKVAEGIFKGLGDFLSGPGLIIGITLIGKMFSRLTVTLADAFKTISAQNKSTALRVKLEKQAFDILAKNPDLLAKVKAGTKGISEAYRKVKQNVENTTTELNEQYVAVKKIVDALMASKTMTLGTGIGAGRLGRDEPLIKASGLIPTERERVIERNAAAGLGYSSGVIKADNVKGVGRVVYGSNESRVQFPGMSSEAIMPPKSSKAGRNYKKDFHASHGFDPYRATEGMLASGFVPNFEDRGSLVHQLKGVKGAKGLVGPAASMLKSIELAGKSGVFSTKESTKVFVARFKKQFSESGAHEAGFKYPGATAFNSAYLSIAGLNRQRSPEARMAESNAAMRRLRGITPSGIEKARRGIAGEYSTIRKEAGLTKGTKKQAFGSSDFSNLADYGSGSNRYTLSVQDGVLKSNNVRQHEYGDAQVGNISIEDHKGKKYLVMEDMSSKGPAKFPSKFKNPLMQAASKYRYPTILRSKLTKEQAGMSDVQRFRQGAGGFVPNFAKSYTVKEIARLSPAIERYIKGGRGSRGKLDRGGWYGKQKMKDYKPTKEGEDYPLNQKGTKAFHEQFPKAGEQFFGAIGQARDKGGSGFVGFDPDDHFSFSTKHKAIDLDSKRVRSFFKKQRKDRPNAKNSTLFEEYIASTITGAQVAKTSNAPLDVIEQKGGKIIGHEVKWLYNPSGTTQRTMGGVSALIQATPDYYAGKALGFGVQLGKFGIQGKKPFYNTKSEPGKLGNLNIYHARPGTGFDLPGGGPGTGVAAHVPPVTQKGRESVRKKGHAQSSRAFASGLIPNFASRTDQEVVQRMTQMLFGPKPTIAGFNNNPKWMNLLMRPGNEHLSERYQILKSASMEKAAKTASRSAEIGKEVRSGAKVNTLFLENLASPTVSPRKPNVRRHGFDPTKLPNVRKTFINSLGTRWKGLMSGVAGDVFNTIPPDKLKSMGGKASLMGGLNIRNLTEAPVALGQVTGRLFEEFINSMSTVVNKNIGETGTERLDMSNRRIKTKYQGLFTPSEAMGLGGQGMEIRAGDITNKKALQKAGLMASGSIPNFAKPLYDLDGTIIREGFFNFKDPKRVLGASSKDLTPLGKQLLQSGESFDIATARGLRDKRSIIESLTRMGLNVGKVFPMGSMYTSRTEMGKRGKPIKMRGPTKKGLFAKTLKRELIDNDPENVRAAGKYGRLVNFAATGIFDSDFLDVADKQSVLSAITSSGKPIKTVMGPAGSGKSTHTKGMGTRIRSMADIQKFNDYILVYGGSASKKGGFTSMGKQVLGATTGGVTVVAPTNENLMRRRSSRIAKGSEDLRTKEQLKGTWKAPMNNYAFYASVKKYMQSRGQSFDLMRASGHIPNFNLGSAISREQAAGVPSSRIRVGASSRLVSSANPSGLGVYNTLHEPGGLGQGINRSRASGLDPKRAGVPNFAKLKSPLDILEGGGDELPKELDALGKEAKGLRGWMQKAGQSEGFQKFQNKALTASFVFPMISGQMQSFVGTESKVGKSFEALSSGVGTAASMMGIGGPWGLAAGALIGTFIAADKMMTAWTSNVDELKREAGDAKQKFTIASNSIASYGQTLQNYQDALKASGDQTQVIIRLQDKMANILKDVPIAFQNQILSAKNATDLQDKVAKGLQEMAKENASVDFAAKLEEMVVGERSGFANLTRRGGEGVGGSFLGMDFDVEVFEEIPGAAKAMANDLKKALDFKKLSSDIRKSGSEISKAFDSGDQLRVIKELRKSFGLTAQAAEGLTDIFGDDLAALFAHLSKDANVIGHVREKTEALTKLRTKHALIIDNLKAKYEGLNQVMDQMIKIASTAALAWAQQKTAMDKFNTAAEKFRLDDIIGDASRAMKTRDPFMTEEVKARGQFGIDAAKRRTTAGLGTRGALDTGAKGRRDVLIKFREQFLSQLSKVQMSRQGKLGMKSQLPVETRALQEMGMRFNAAMESAKFAEGSLGQPIFEKLFAEMRDQAKIALGGNRGIPAEAAEGIVLENKSIEALQAMNSETIKQTNTLMMLHQTAKAQEKQAKKDYDAQLKQIQIQKDIAAAGKAEGFAAGAGDKIMGDFADAMATMRFGRRSGNQMLMGRGATMAEMSIQQATGGPSGNMALRNMAVRGRQEQLSGMFGMMGLGGARSRAGIMGQRNIDALFKPEGVPGAVGAAGAAQARGIDPRMLQMAHKQANIKLESLAAISNKTENSILDALKAQVKLQEHIANQETAQAKESAIATFEKDIKEAKTTLKKPLTQQTKEELASKGKELEEIIKRLGLSTNVEIDKQSGRDQMNSFEGMKDGLNELADKLEDIAGKKSEGERLEAKEKAFLKDIGKGDMDAAELTAYSKALSDSVDALTEGGDLQTKLNTILRQRIVKETAEAGLRTAQANYSGHIPNFSRSMEKAGVKGNPQYSASQSATATPQRRHINGKPTWLNTSETVVPNFAGSGKQAVLTPEMRRGFGMANGYIPNFAFGGKGIWDKALSYKEEGGSAATGGLAIRAGYRKFKHGGKPWSGNAGVDQFLNSNLNKQGLRHFGRRQSGTISAKEAKKIGNLFKSVKLYEKLNPDFYKGKSPFGSVNNMLKGLGDIPSPAEVKRMVKEMSALEKFLPHSNHDTPSKIKKFHKSEAKNQAIKAAAKKSSAQTKIFADVLNKKAGHIDAIGGPKQAVKTLDSLIPNAPAIRDYLQKIVDSNPDMSYKEAAKTLNARGGKTFFGAKVPSIVKEVKNQAAQMDFDKNHELGSHAKTGVKINRAPGVVAETTKRAAATAEVKKRSGLPAKTKSATPSVGSRPKVPIRNVRGGPLSKGLGRILKADLSAIPESALNKVISAMPPDMQEAIRTGKVAPKARVGAPTRLPGMAGGGGGTYRPPLTDFKGDVIMHGGRGSVMGERVTAWLGRNASLIKKIGGPVARGLGKVSGPLSAVIEGGMLAYQGEQSKQLDNIHKSFEAEVLGNHKERSKTMDEIGVSIRDVHAYRNFNEKLGKHRAFDKVYREAVDRTASPGWGGTINPFSENFSMGNFGAPGGYGTYAEYEDKLSTVPGVRQYQRAMSTWNDITRGIASGIGGGGQQAYLTKKQFAEMQSLKKETTIGGELHKQSMRANQRFQYLTSLKASFGADFLKHDDGSFMTGRELAHRAKLEEIKDRGIQSQKDYEKRKEDFAKEGEEIKRSKAASDERRAYWNMAGMALGMDNSHSDFKATKNLRSELGGPPTLPPFLADNRVEGRILREWAGSSWTMEEGRMKTILKGGTNTGGMDSDTVVTRFDPDKALVDEAGRFTGVGGNITTSHDGIVKKIKAWSDWKKDNKNLFLRNDKIKAHNEKWNLRLREAAGGTTNEQIKAGLFTSENWDAKGISPELQKRVINKLKAQIIPSAAQLSGMSEEMFQYLKNEKEPYDWRTGAHGIIPNFAHAGYGVGMGGTGATGSRRGTTFDSLLMQTRSQHRGVNKGVGWFQNPFYRKVAMSNPGMRGLMNPTGFGSARSWNTSGAYAANGLTPSLRASQSREKRQSGRSDVYTRYVHTPNFSGYATFNGSERGMEESIVRAHPNPKRAGATPNFATDFKDITNALNSLRSQISMFTESVSSIKSATGQQTVQTQAQIAMSPLNININHSGKLTAEVEAVQTQISIAINNAMKQIAPALWRTIKGPATA